MMRKTVIIFGHGYVANFLIEKLNALGYVIYCTSRKVEIGRAIQTENLSIINFLDPALPAFIKSSHVLLSTVPPNNEIIDPVLNQYGDFISKHIFEWVGYLSSTSVYGDHHGAWVDEETQCAPMHNRSKIRFLAEQQWLGLYSKNKLPVHILRLSGIYGPHRNCLAEINNGKDFTIVKKHHFFSRIHVEDICMATIASINSPTPGEIYNISDDEPAPLHVVQQCGASLLNKNNLKEIPLEASQVSHQTQSFFNDNKKVNNQKIRQTLNIQWIYPNYIVGLKKGCLPDFNTTQ